MNYLIFRTDRIGDFLLTLPLIKTIKESDSKAKIHVVTSPKNNEYVESNFLIDKVFLLKSNSFFEKLNLFFKIKKFGYKVIIVSDKKNRSILLSIFLKSEKKIFNVSKFFQKKFLNFFYKDVFLDNDHIKDYSMKDIIIMNCRSLNMDFKNQNYNFFPKNHFKNQYELNHKFNADNNNFILFHYDEKWELENYSKVFKKAKNLTNINTSAEELKEFLIRLIDKKSMKIIITTGYLKTNLITDLIVNSTKIEESLYRINDDIFLIVNQSFNSISHLISKSQIFISCHGAFTHIASNYNIKTIDIIEKNKKQHYLRITNHIKNYNYIYRDDFQKLKKNINNFV